jgi:hypothetical protein
MSSALEKRTKWRRSSRGVVRPGWAAARRSGHCQRGVLDTWRGERPLTSLFAGAWGVHPCQPRRQASTGVATYRPGLGWTAGCARVGIVSLSLVVWLPGGRSPSPLLKPRGSLYREDVRAYSIIMSFLTALCFSSKRSCANFPTTIY